jgi:hypothetical protein
VRAEAAEHREAMVDEDERVEPERDREPEPAPPAEVPAPAAPPPRIERLRPAAGPLAGGTEVVIEGAGFADGCEVKIDRVPVKAAYRGPTELVLTTLPRNMPGPVDVDVLCPDGQRTLVIRGYEYCMAPALTGVAPDHGPESGGTVVTLTGSDLREGAEVTVGASRPQVDYRGPSRVELAMVAHPAGTYDVELVNPDGQRARLAAAFRFDGRPRVERVVPDHGPPAGTRIVVEGHDFRIGCEVHLGGVRIRADLESSTRIVATAPPRGAAGPLVVRVVNADGLDGERAEAFSYEPPPGPRVLAVSPARVVRGREQPAVVAGEGFVEGCSVRVAGVPAPMRYVSPERLEVSLPALDRVGSYDVEVVNPDSQSHRLDTAFELRGAPRLASVQPVQGSDVGGEVLTLTGLGFERGCEASVGGFPARTSWEAETTVRAVAPPRALAGPVDVVVANPDGQSATLESAFTYVARQAPVITGILPTAGPTTGGTGVIVRGDHLDSVTQVLVGGRLAAGFKARGGELAFVTPPRSREGAADLELRTRDGASTVRKNAFQYAAVPPPAIRSLAPNRGGVGGGTEVTIAGENFVAGATVLVDGEPVAATKVRDSATIVFTTPRGEAGVMVDVVVRSPTGQEALAKRAFLYDPRYG